MKCQMNFITKNVNSRKNPEDLTIFPKIIFELVINEYAK